jgi:hypothetical protein
MTRRGALSIVIAAGLLGLAGAAQQQTNEDTLSPAEKRIPAGHYCKRSNVMITSSEKNAHPCDCKYSCSVDQYGNVTEHESTDCLAYCQKNGRRCTCHVEEPCDPKGGRALMDMNHRVVAMPRRDRAAQAAAPIVEVEAARTSVRSTLR